MLVLSRRKNESIVIGDDITITVVDIRGDKVRLGIEAPKFIPVHRREVYNAIKASVDKNNADFENPIDRKNDAQYAEPVAPTTPCVEVQSDQQSSQEVVNE